MSLLTSFGLAVLTGVGFGLGIKLYSTLDDLLRLLLKRRMEKAE